MQPVKHSGSWSSTSPSQSSSTPLSQTSAEQVTIGGRTHDTFSARDTTPPEVRSTDGSELTCMQFAAIPLTSTSYSPVGSPKNLTLPLAGTPADAARIRLPGK